MNVGLLTKINQIKNSLELTREFFVKEIIFDSTYLSLRN